MVTAWGREHKAAYAADQQDRKAGFQDCLTLCIKQQFVAGLKPAIKQVIESKYASLTTRTLLLKAAKEAEIAVSTGPDKRIIEIEQELSALRLAQGAGCGSSPGCGGGQSGAGRGRGSGRGGGQGSQASAPSPGQGQSQDGGSGLSHKEKIQLRKNWIICHKCWQWGKHRANECKLTSAQLQKLTPMDAYSRPTGVPHDSQFESKN